MSNIVSLRHPARGSCDDAIPGLVDLFSRRRRGRHDPFWLKENAELLQILAAIGASVDLEPLQALAKGLPEDLRFFPQYYRMYLSLALDLRDLGMVDVPVSEMAAFVHEQDLPAIELSDTHRGEAHLLLQRAGGAAGDTSHEARLLHFARRSSAFCLPNRRAAYDLTHLVFHAANYGRRSLPWDPARRLSLMHVGIVAWLESNLDLLSEVTLALRFSGESVPASWDECVAQAVDQVAFREAHPGDRFDDDYHQFLVLNWAHGVAGHTPFQTPLPARARIVRYGPKRNTALHELSLALLDMGQARRPEWRAMRWRLWPKLSEPTRHCLECVEVLPEFDGFFAGFSRAAPFVGGRI